MEVGDELMGKEGEPTYIGFLSKTFLSSYLECMMIVGKGA